MELLKYALTHTLVAWVGVSEGSETPPPSREDTPVISVATAVQPPQISPMLLRDGTTPNLPSPTIYCKDKDGKLILLPSPRLYFRDERGRLIPVDELFEESDLETTDDEDFELVDAENAELD